MKGWKILDTNNALTLFVALLSLVAVRQQFIATLKPYLTYSSFFSQSGKLVPEGAKGSFWKVDIHNAGTGIAIVRSATYRVSFGREDRTRDYTLAYDDVLDEFAERGLRYGDDFMLTRLSEGAIIGPQSTDTILEIWDDRVGDVSTLDIRLEFESRASEQFVKEIFCIPRAGLPNRRHLPASSPPA